MGLNQHAPSRSPKKFDIPKVKKSETSSTLFSWRNGRLKKVLAESDLPLPIRVNKKPDNLIFQANCQKLRTFQYLTVAATKNTPV